MNVKMAIAVALVGLAPAACVTSKSTSSPGPAAMSVSSDGKVVTMTYRDGAPFASIYDVPAEYCRKRGEKAVLIDVDAPRKKGENRQDFFCSNGSTQDVMFLNAHRQKQVDRYNARLRESGRDPGRSMTQEEINATAQRHIQSLERTARAMNNQGACRYFDTYCLQP